MPAAKKIAPVLISASIIFLVVYYMPPPANWDEASTLQILTIFLPILAFFTFFPNLFLCNILKSFALGLGALVLLVLWSSGFFNLITVLAVFMITACLFKFLPKRVFGRRFTPGSNKGKLSKLKRIK